MIHPRATPTLVQHGVVNISPDVLQSHNIVPVPQPSLVPTDQQIAHLQNLQQQITASAQHVPLQIPQQAPAAIQHGAVTGAQQQIVGTQQLGYSQAQAIVPLQLTIGTQQTGQGNRANFNQVQQQIVSQGRRVMFVLKPDIIDEEPKY